MKVLNTDKQEYNSKTVCICDECESEIEVNRSECEIGWNGWAAFDCPVCGEKVYPGKWDLALSESNIEYPLHFHTTKQPSVKLSNEEISSLVRQAVSALKAKPEQEFAFRATANVIVIALRCDGDKEIYIVVSEKYSDCTVTDWVTYE